MRQLKKICILIAGILLVSCCFATDIYAQAAEGETQECYTHEFYQKKYTSGCWSCLVLEKLTSAFLKVASAAMPICEKAGHILLIWGFVIWMCFWALKNVASFTEIKSGNILNEFLQMAGRVVIAYVCITMGTTAIRQFIITPIMGVGATMAQNFWSKNKSISNYNKALAEYTQPFLWEDEIVTPEQAEILRDKIEESYTRSTPNETGNSSQGTEEDASADAPQEVVGDPDEATVQLFQRAHIAILKQQMQTILTSCTSPEYKNNNGRCNNCRTAGCKDLGHQKVVRQFFVNAKHNSQVAAYCICSITSALELLNKEICGEEHDKSCNIANFNRSSSGTFNGVPDVKGRPGIIGCGVGIDEATKYKNAVIGGNRGYDANLKEAASKGNIGDIVYLKVGKQTASGYHAVTYLGVSNSTIAYMGFNGDDDYGIANWVKSGVIVKTGEIIRQRLKAHKGVKYNKKRLEEIAEGSGINQSWINYTGGDLGGTGDAFLSEGPESLIVEIPDVKYTGPTDIMPKSIADSLIGATKAITDTTAQFMVLGNMVMCFSNMKDGGAWDLKLFTMTNIFMWLDAAILWVLGFILTCVVAYYLIDMSFKIGFAVMALPIVMGLWPFKITQDKLASTIAIIAKSSALFAFLALATYYGLELVVASFGGAEGLGGIFNDFDKVVSGSVSAEEKEKIVETLEDNFYIFSTKFLMMLFGAIYTYKIISKTTKELVDKFYPDNVFGGENPMHKMMTGMASMANNLNKKYGTGLVGDMASNAAGKAVKGAASKAVSGTKAVGRATGGAIRGAIRGVSNKIRGASKK